MKKRIILFITVLFAFSLLAGACAPQPAREESELATDQPLQITVSILPQAYFVERIGGDLVAVNAMVGPGDDAHTYEPKPDQMIALSESTLFFSIGIEYEETWLPRFTDVNPEMEIVDNAEGIERIMETIPHTNDDKGDHAEEADHLDDEEGQPDDDDHGLGQDPHVWLTPANGKIIARNIYDALVSANPENAEVFTTNYETLITEIDDLDSRITATLSDVNQRNFMVYHPAWGYFADAYGLTQLPVQIGGVDPSARELAALIDLALEEDIRVIFVQPQFSDANARAIAQEIGGEVVKIDPLSYDWLANLEMIAEAFASALSN